MGRPEHELKAPKRTSRPEYHIFFDIETNVIPSNGNWADHTFKLGWAIFWRRRTDGQDDQEDWYEIKDKEEFWKWVVSKAQKGKKLIVSSHNIGYDCPITSFHTILPKLGWGFTYFFDRYKVSIWEARNNTKTIQFVDNVNWFKGRLEEWGEVIGLPKLGGDPLTATDEELHIHCKRDVDILLRLWKWWYDFMDEHDLGTWKLTVSAQAFNAFNYRFKSHKIVIHNKSEALDLERESYHGGRCEEFRIGKFTGEPFYKLDVNSMYPWAMKNHKFPVKLRGTFGAISLEHLDYFLDNCAIIAEVTVDIDEPYFSVVAWGKVVYPVGEFKCVLSTPELELSRSKGWIKEVHRIAYYNQAPIFEDYVDYFHPLKAKYTKEGKPYRSRLVKLMLNSLYGKFAQKGTTIKRMCECDPERFERIIVHDSGENPKSVEIYIGGSMFVETHGGESFHSFPAIAAHVTAYARLYLYRLVLLAGRKNVHYIDTDCLIVNQAGYDNLQFLIQPGVLGSIELEDEAMSLDVRARKDYTFGTTDKIKGIREDAERIGDDTFRQVQFPSMRGLLQRGDSKRYRTRMITKTLMREVYSGEVDEDGYLHPLDADELFLD